jgi:hypothetical protein
LFGRFAVNPAIEANEIPSGKVLRCCLSHRAMLRRVCGYASPT